MMMKMTSLQKINECMTPVYIEYQLSPNLCPHLYGTLYFLATPFLCQNGARVVRARRDVEYFAGEVKKDSEGKASTAPGGS